MHPVYGSMLFFLELTGGAVIEVEPDIDSSFDVDLSTLLEVWDTMDADVDGIMFPDDQDEVIALSCSLFFEGYLEDGTEFTGSFPPPLKLYFEISHAA